MAPLLHLTENRNIQKELQERNSAVKEQISIFKSISAICCIAMVVLFFFVLYLICFLAPEPQTGINLANLPIMQDEPKQKGKVEDDTAELENLALELEENEDQLLRSPSSKSDELTKIGNAIQVVPPQVRYKGYYSDEKSKSAIIEVADSRHQIVLREKQKFYSGTAQLIKIKKEEIIWKWQGKLYVTKLGLN